MSRSGLTLARSSPAASIGYRVFVSRAIVGANGLFVAREIDGGAVDLIGLFELHALALYDTALRLMPGGG